MFEKLPPPKRILLIEPPFFKLFGYKRWHYPIGLTVVGTYLEELGHVVKILDADRPTADCREYNRTEAGDNYYKYSEALEKLDHPEWMQINAVVEEFKPDIVGISASISAKIDSANIIAKNIKQKYRDKVLTVLGGTHVNVMRSMYPDYDFGDYYDEVSLYIADIFDRRPNKKLLIDYQHYAPESFCSVWTSMGCPNACTFCCYSGNRKVLFRSIDNIRSELIDIRKEYNNAFPVYFLDDSFISYNKRFYEITEISRGLGLKFKAGGHVMDLSPEKIETFIKNGGLRIYIGIESGSQRVLDKIKKRLRVEEIIRRTKWLNDVGLPWSAFFIVGFPFETIEDLKLTEELMNKIQPTFISLNHFTPYPGTEIYKEYYLNANIKFRDLFQINRNNYLSVDDKTKDYMDRIFANVDAHNQKNNLQLKTAGAGGVNERSK